MRHRIAFLCGSLLVLVQAAGCIGTAPPSHNVNSALDFLYPHGITDARPASEVVLKLPLRVGLAFAPNRNPQADPITEAQKQQLLGQVAAAFKEHQANLRTALARFDEQARNGTVQGPGTPAIAMYDAKGERITAKSGGGGGGGGALGIPELFLAVLIGLSLLARRRAAGA